MLQPFDLMVYGWDRRLVLPVDVQAATDFTTESASYFRDGLLEHELLPDAPYFLIATPVSLYLWRSETPPGHPPDFEASATPILSHYVPSMVRRGEPFNSFGVEAAMFGWFGDMAAGFRTPDDRSEPDRMLMQSGLLKAIQRGQVRFGDDP